jgi:hypothetical protein
MFAKWRELYNNSTKNTNKSEMPVPYIEQSKVAEMILAGALDADTCIVDVRLVDLRNLTFVEGIIVVMAMYTQDISWVQ